MPRPDQDETRSTPTPSERDSGPPDHMEKPGRGTEFGARQGADEAGDPADASLPEVSDASEEESDHGDTP